MTMILKYMGLKIRNKILKQNKGFTLVELMVTFALLGLFMVAVTKVISYTVIIYHEAKAADYGLEVAGELGDKVSGIVSSMRVDIDMSLNDILKNGDMTKLPCVKDGSFYMMDATGCPVSIGKDDAGYLKIVYYKENEDKSYKAVPWYFDKKAYMGYSIQDFNLDKASGEYPDNVYKFEVTLHSDRYGEYSASRYIRCMVDTP